MYFISFIFQLWWNVIQKNNNCIIIIIIHMYDDAPLQENPHLGYNEITDYNKDMREN